MHLMLPPASATSLSNLTPSRALNIHSSIIMLTCYFFVLNKLWTLCTFSLSFSSLDPLFSSFYRLFCKNTGGWGTLTAKIPADSTLGQSVGELIMGINHWISRVTHGANIDAPYHLC